jgi:hypothetical protein
VNIATTVSAAGNITGNYIVGNGSQLTGVVATGIGTLASLSVTGNIDTGNLRTAGQVSATGNVQGNYIIGNGSELTAITGANVTGTVANATFATSAGSAATAGSANTAATVTGNAQANITSVGILTSLSSTGNIDGANINGNGSGLSNITGANVTGTVANATYATSAGSATTAGSANTAATVTGNAQANITSVGILTSLSSTGNIDGANINGNGSGLASITGANVTGTVANATFATSAGSANTANTATSANTAATVTGNAQANITSVGVLTSLSVSGNINGSNVNASTVQATGSGGLALKNSGGTTQASLGAGGGDNFAINVSTNLNGNNAQIDISPTGTGHVHIKPTGTGAVEVAPTNTGSINNMIIGNVTPAAVSATTVSASGNITGNYFLGNGSQLTGLPVQPGTYGNANVVANLAALGTNPVSTTGNVSAGYFVGNGSLLSNIAGANVTGNVANANTANTATFLVASTNSAVNMSIVTANSKILLPGGGEIGFGGDPTFDPLSVGSVDILAPQTYLANSYVSFTWANQANIMADPLNVCQVSKAGISMYYDAYANAKFIQIGSGGVETNAAFSATGNITGGNLRTVGLVSATGNVTGNYFLGNGSQLTGLPATYGNANVAANLAAFGSNPISTTGNITAGYFVGNGSLLSNIAAANVTGNVANANAAVFLKSSTNAAVNMSIDATFGQINLPGGAIINYSGDGDPNTIGSINLIGTQANLANSYAQLTFVNQANFFANPLNIMRTSNVGISLAYDALSSFGGVKGMNLGAAGLTTDTLFSATGNITGANIRTAGSVSATGNVNAGNLVVTGNIVDTGALTISTGSNGNIALTPNGSGLVTASSAISATGNVTANYFLGNGSQLTGITASSANSAVFLRASTNAAVNMSIDATTGLISIPGGGFISYAGFDAPTFGSIDISAPQANIANSYVSFSHFTAANSSATPVNVCQVDINGISAFYDAYDQHSGIKGLRVGSSGIETINAPFSASGNITGANIRTAGSVSATGNVLGGNLIVTGGIIDTGALTIVTGSNGNIALTPNGTGQVTASSAISATGNVTGGNIITVGVVSTTGRVIGANYTESVNAIGNSGGTVSPNISLGSIQSITLTSNLTFNSITNIQAGQSFTFVVTQDATGSRTLTSTMLYAGGSKTLSTAAGAVDIISVFYNGTTYYASLTKGYS